MLQSFTIRGFKSVDEATIRFEPVTFLIGANASGKSNVLEGLALLSWLAAGGRLAHLLGDMRDGRSDIRGPLGGDALEFSFACTIGAGPAEPSSPSTSGCTSATNGTTSCTRRCATRMTPDPRRPRCTR